MKNTLIALAVLALTATAAQAHYNPPVVVGNPQTSQANSNGVTSSSGAFATSSGNGASLSVAGNKQTAVSTLGASAGATQNGHNPVVVSGSADASGSAVTTSLSGAANISSGNASGNAAAGGVSLVNAASSASFNTGVNKPVGSVAGNLGSVAQTSVSTGTNGGAIAGGSNTVGYTGGAAATKVGNTDSYLNNTAVTNAVAGSVSASGSGAIGAGVVGTVNVGGDALVNATAKSGNVISTN